MIIQVTEHLNSDNLNPEIKGLKMAKKRIPNSKRLLLTEEVEQAINLPDWCDVAPISTWFLE